MALNIVSCVYVKYNIMSGDVADHSVGFFMKKNLREGENSKIINNLAT